jgi:hypothetical protein
MKQGVDPGRHDRVVEGKKTGEGTAQDLKDLSWRVTGVDNADVWILITPARG